ncbi:MAG: MoaD/ThiS family protein [Synergistales bacterium]|nr:MoaD/ThiS family protein [Synergistales bacterium]
MKVAFFGTFRNVTDCKAVEVPEQPTVRDLLAALADRYGTPFRRMALTEAGEISSQTIILVNGRHIVHLNGGDTELASGDEVSVFPLLAGG